MIRSLSLILAQGATLHAGCVTINAASMNGMKQTPVVKSFGVDNGNFVELNDEQGEEETIVTGLSFTASVYFNENTFNQGLPPFALLDEKHNSVIEIDFDKHKEIELHFESGFADGATLAQRIEGTCEKYIKDVLSVALKNA